jgi:HD superfamily phosphohydrolase
MRSPSPPPKEIRDPIHGAIQADSQELTIIDHPAVQRLRGIRQLGFSHLPFPGATHTRYAHSLGAMHLAGQAFDACFRDHPFSSLKKERAYRHCVRLAALCHDLGHPPFSHAAEFAMPPLRMLGLSAYRADAVASRLDKRATHEDYTIGLLTASALAPEIRREFPFDPTHVAALVSNDVQVDDDFFEDGGMDLRPLFSQLISSALDVDRMDYLVRDAYYTGARYGQVDVPWLISHLSRHVLDTGEVCLALDRRAIYAFDDFMVARFHMFVMVYFHQKSIAYEEMLKLHMGSNLCTYRLPADLELYRETDDAHLWSYLRTCDDPWAHRVVNYRPFKVVHEIYGRPFQVDVSEPAAKLQAAGLPYFAASASGALFDGSAKQGPPIFVLDRKPGAVKPAKPLSEASDIFQRYHDRRSVARLYVDRCDLEKAREILGSGS